MGNVFFFFPLPKENIVNGCVEISSSVGVSRGKLHVMHKQTQLIKNNLSCAGVSEHLMPISDFRNPEPTLAKQPNKAPRGQQHLLPVGEITQSYRSPRSPTLR